MTMHCGTRRGEGVNLRQKHTHIVLSIFFSKTFFILEFLKSTFWGHPLFHFFENRDSDSD